MLQQLHQSSIFGIWYLINNLNRQDGFDKEMVAWLIAFCGQSFCPNLTIVTTFWTGEGGMLQNQNRNLRQRLDEEWAQLQACGAQHHAFGKYYVNGIPQESTISLFDPARREELEQQAEAWSLVTSIVKRHHTPRYFGSSVSHDHCTRPVLAGYSSLKINRCRGVLHPRKEEHQEKLRMQSHVYQGKKGRNLQHGPLSWRHWDTHLEKY